MIASLLCALPLAMLGQTSLSVPPARPGLKKYETDGWLKLWLEGGMIRTRDAQNRDKRTGRHYLVIENGISSLVNMDYVDGYMFGPQFRLGYLDDRYGRWELDTDVKYACGRNTWMYQGALRYVLPPEYFGSVEVFGRSFTTDFDSNPIMPRRYQLLASGLFGWNGFKLYGSNSMGVKGDVALSGDFQLSGVVWYEDRERMVNHRKRNVFRVVGEDNLPRLRGHDVTAFAADPLLNWNREHLTRLQMQLDYCPGRKIIVTDDMHAKERLVNPTLTLKGDAGFDETAVRFVSLELSIRQTELELSPKRHWLSYYGAAGFFPLRKEVSVPDWKHFDASHYLWQTRNSLTWFSLLTNYELSTSRNWCEAHAEWLSEEMLLSRLTDSWLNEYLQVHYVTVAGHRPHTELSYGIDLVKQIRMGVSCGFDGSEFDGWAFNLIWDISKK